MEKEFNLSDENEDVVVTFNEKINNMFDMDLGLELKRYLINLINEKDKEFLEIIEPIILDDCSNYEKLQRIRKLAGDKLIKQQEEKNKE